MSCFTSLIQTCTETQSIGKILWPGLLRVTSSKQKRSTFSFEIKMQPFQQNDCRWSANSERMVCVRHLPNLIMVPANKYMFAGTISKFGKCLTQSIFAKFADQKSSIALIICYSLLREQYRNIWG